MFDRIKAALLALTVLAASLFSSCGEAESAYGAALRYASETPGMEGERVIYRSGAGINDPEYLPDGEFYALYYFGKPDAGEAELIDDWCVMLAASPNVAEVHVLRVRHKSGVTAVGRMAEARARVLRSPELFASKSGFFGSRPDDVRVIVDGRYVILIAS